jgi:antibiotic biosynthesis monooxygenase (ABM) superfamily enzyme
VRKLHGLEAFFRGDGPPPPKWKMAVVTWFGVTPTVYVFSTLLPLLPGELPPLVEFLIINALVVVALAWLVMPLLTKIFSRWLKPRSA